jgi:hypothetical protein
MNTYPKCKMEEAIEITLIIGIIKIAIIITGKTDK